MPNNSPYHEGELKVQNKLGTSDIARISGKMITRRIPGGALSFIAQQPMTVIGSISLEGKVWASVIFGAPGFVHAVDESTVELNLTDSALNKSDPLWENIKTQHRIGMIIIESSSRRRLRINGRLNKKSELCYQIEIDQAFPNCPKYIQRRHISKASLLQKKENIINRSGRELGPNQQHIILSADTFFVSSIYSESGKNNDIDTSHRGGQPGFVKIINNRLLRVPDYPGNNMFNTLGNFETNPHAGLVFIDYDNKKLLQLTGLVKIIWHSDNTDNETAGTLRHWEFSIDSWRESNIAFDIEWEYMDASPFNP